MSCPAERQEERQRRSASETSLTLRPDAHQPRQIPEHSLLRLPSFLDSRMFTNREQTHAMFYFGYNDVYFPNLTSATLTRSLHDHRHAPITPLLRSGSGHLPSILRPGLRAGNASGLPTRARVARQSQGPRRELPRSGELD